MNKLPSLQTPDGPVKTLSEWREFARRDDCLARMVPSDLRRILSFVKEQDAEIKRLRTLNAEMREALESFVTYGCPVCGGDCASANPPVYRCPMRAAHAALSAFTAGGDDG